MTFESKIREVGRVAFPAYRGTRVMMMPFHLHDVTGTLPDEIAQWRALVAEVVAMGPVHHGTAYLTLDEAAVASGETHRRPGLHVDGVGPRGEPGGWGGGGGGWGSKGMLMVSTRVGCVAWEQIFDGWPGPDGDCEHLAGQRRDDARVVLRPGIVYHCGPMTVHQALPMMDDCRRSFVRVSMPSDAPWYEGYTENPTGVQPTGPIHPRREAQMAYRP